MNNNIKKKLIGIGAALALSASAMAEDGVPKNGLVENPYLIIQAGQTTQDNFNNRVFFGADIKNISLSGFYSANNLDNSDSFGVYDIVWKNDTKISPFLRATTDDGNYDETYIGARTNLENILPNTSCNVRLLTNTSTMVVSENICSADFGKFNATGVYSLTFEKNEKPSHYLELQVDVPLGNGFSLYGRVEDLESAKDRFGVIGISKSF